MTTLWSLLHTASQVQSLFLRLMLWIQLAEDCPFRPPTPALQDTTVPRQVSRITSRLRSPFQPILPTGCLSPTTRLRPRPQSPWTWAHLVTGGPGRTLTWLPLGLGGSSPVPRGGRAAPPGYPSCPRRGGRSGAGFALLQPCTPGWAVTGSSSQLTPCAWKDRAAGNMYTRFRGSSPSEWPL